MKAPSPKSPRRRSALGRLLCRMGLHDFALREVTMAFGSSGSVEKLECRRCGLVTTRHGQTK